MTDKQLELIQQIISLLGQSGHVVVGEYTTWFIASAITWCVIGIVCLYGAWVISKQDNEDRPWFIIGIVLAVVGVLALGCNLPDLFAPKAAAVHQLLRDLVPPGSH